ncbi:stage VI sporulation protein D [Anaerobacillus alkalidiazotrophicus]|uniref:Stage VI sporulation protein D n=1 Tax=Anaerobacillus alkalidiazotrophicus TaxID=472963 RepID=A0A1S2M5T8_9BACI|nr:stage VI sporulation protein D [Anaerobacillus alkalidiazotrophicus]OIJ18354.1 stage VI sporulation protein D [Anaerobacillus alkalidiazotrophicus]OIJ19833.1 stage VI sporulation protein D [Anaerobacillus alkalidiazotrophicus]
MTQDHSSKLSFSIEESVWLNKGQEVDEIVSLSLDPEITVQENGDYVLIRGGLKLTGEYRSNGNSNSSEKESDSLSDQVAYRSIEEVTLNSDGTGEIKHYFPIDVTIPQERIRSLDEIYVIVESFDYDLPERGCIQLTADIAITGMSSGNAQRDAQYSEESAVDTLNSYYEEETDTKEQDTSLENEERTFHYEAYNQQDTVVPFPSEEVRYEESELEINIEEVSSVENEEEVLEEIEEPVEAILEENDKQEEERTEEDTEEEVLEEVEEPVEAILEENDEQEEERTGEDTEVDIDKVVAEETDEVIEEVEVTNEVTEEVKSPAIAFGVIKERPKQEVVVGENEEPLEEKDQSFSTLKSLAGDRKQVVKNEERHEEAEVEVTEVSLVDEEQEKVETPPREENALYLTKMLSKGEEEEFKKLKMCIIQESETLDTIAARYEITQSALIKVNRLNDAEVQEGQILYIPVPQ